MKKKNLNFFEAVATGNFKCMEVHISASRCICLHSGYIFGKNGGIAKHYTGIYRMKKGD